MKSNEIDISKEYCNISNKAFKKKKVSIKTLFMDESGKK